MATEPLDLEAIKARAEAATEGPWVATTPHDEASDWASEWDHPMVVTGDSGPGGYVAIASSISQGDDPEGQADAEFIAHARTDVPALLAEIERLKTALGACQTALKFHLGVCTDAVARGATPDGGAR